MSYFASPPKTRALDTSFDTVYYVSNITTNSENFSNINVMKTPKNFTMSLHSHDFYHVNRILEGELTVIINNKRYDLPCGTTFVLPPSVPHALYSEGGYTQIGTDVICNNDPKGLFGEFTSLCDGFAYITIPVVPAVASLQLEQMVALLSSPTRANTLRALNIVEAQLLDLLDKQRGSVATEFTARFTELAKNHRLWELSLSDICKLLLLSRTELERQSHKSFGCGAAEYCARLRFSKACEMLQNNVSLAEITDALSFFDVAHFSKFFTKRAKMPPGQYRKSLQ